MLPAVPSPADAITHERPHFKYGASSFARFRRCPGSVRRLAAVPRRSSKYAEEGTKAHHILEIALTHRSYATDAWFGSDYWAYPPDKDMCAHVDDVLSYIYAILRQHPDAQMVAETQVCLPTKNAPGEVGGTADCMIWVPSTRTLYVIDFKYGAGVAVEVDRNDQLMFYGCGAVFNAADGVQHVALVIAQPRAHHRRGPVREYWTTPDELLDFMLEVEDAVAAAEREDAPLVPGDEQCKWCERVGCPAVEQALLSAAGSHFRSIRELDAKRLPEPRAASPDQIAYVLAIKEFIEPWFKDYEAYALELARAGVPIPGHKLVETKAKRTWFGDDEHLAQQLMALSGAEYDSVMPRKLLTITDAERLVIRSFRERGEYRTSNAATEAARKAMAFLTVKEGGGGTTLVPLTDKRPAISIARNSFAQIAPTPPPIQD